MWKLLPVQLGVAAAAAAMWGATASAPAQDAPVTVIHVVADDLGYHDVGFRNGQSLSPTIDALAASGVEIREFYVYKMCSPSRGSVLTGRYPWHLGYYDNNGGDTEGVSLKYHMTPRVLNTSGRWRSHALGKWHAGWLFMNYTGAERGFDTFFGSSGNTDNYWYHYTTHGPLRAYDFVDLSAGAPVQLATAENKTYDAHSLSNRAVELIHSHDKELSMYMYLAYHNVHLPSNAPLETVERFPRIASDARKVANAMLLELDTGLANVSAALESNGMLDRAIFFIHTDNGGPASHACNYPLRGGKFTFWEGGVRGFAVASSKLFPAAVRGTQFNGMAHLADLYATIIVGIAGMVIPLDTGPIPPDSHNLWDALMNGTASPRTEVVHLPLDNQYANTTVCQDPTHGCAPSIRIGRFKLMTAYPGYDTLWSLPPPAAHPIPYGQSGGVVEPGTDHAIGPHWGPGGKNQSAVCSEITPCLFDVVADPGENKNLGGDPQYAAVVANLTARLREVSKSAAPYAYLVSKEEGRMLTAAQMYNINVTGAWLPLGFNGTAIPVPPPTPGICSFADIATVCPSRTASTCRDCCHDHATQLHNQYGCKPKDFSAYCGTTTTE